MQNNLTMGSLFDGAGTFPLAASMYGIKTLWASEIAPYPIAVTTSRFPDVKHLGSVTDINGAEIEPVDIITVSSPCQNLSQAGNRAGLKGEQSILFHDGIRIIKEMYEATGGKYPKYAVWENVPGAFSSNKGEDFKVVLEQFIQIAEPDAPALPMPHKNKWPKSDVIMGDGWSLAYRTLNADGWGVPQRRRRVFLVLSLGNQRAAEILFKQEGLRGYFEKGISPWQTSSAASGKDAPVPDPERRGGQ